MYIYCHLNCECILIVCAGAVPWYEQWLFVPSEHGRKLLHPVANSKSYTTNIINFVTEV